MSYRNPNSFLRFADLVASGEKDIAKSNLFSVEITLPPMMYAQGNYPQYREHYESINYFADSVTLPARRIKTQSVKMIGQPYDYAYGQQKQEVRMSFIMTKDMYHRQFFETWMNMTANDAEMAKHVYGKAHFDEFHKEHQKLYKPHYLRQVKPELNKIYAFPCGLPRGWSKKNKIHFVAHS